MHQRGYMTNHCLTLSFPRIRDKNQLWQNITRVVFYIVSTAYALTRADFKGLQVDNPRPRRSLPPWNLSRCAVQRAAEWLEFYDVKVYIDTFMLKIYNAGEERLFYLK